MGMHTLGILPLIHELNQYARQVWFADDATAGEKLTSGGIHWFALVLPSVTLQIHRRPGLF